jgi:hypothetical protein
VPGRRIDIKTQCEVDMKSERMQESAGDVKRGSFELPVPSSQFSEASSFELQAQYHPVPFEESGSKLETGNGLGAGNWELGTYPPAAEPPPNAFS